MKKTTAPTIEKYKDKPEIIKSNLDRSVSFGAAPPSQFSVKPNENNYKPRMRSNPAPEMQAKELGQYEPKVYPYDRSAPQPEYRHKQELEASYKDKNDKSVDELLGLTKKTNLDLNAIKRKTFKN